MALAQDTDYILLDEPTTYLDVAHRIELMRLLSRLADSGKGIVAVTHDLLLSFDFSDTVVAIHDGRVVAAAAPSQIYTSDVIKECFGVKIERREDNKFYYNY